MSLLDAGLESVAKRTFAWAIDWPGWCRSAKTAELAQDALIAARPRYAVVVGCAGLVLPEILGSGDLQIIETVDGNGGTEFGVPSIITASDHRPTTAAEAERLSGLVAAAWAILDEVTARTPESLRKGPRGGGRDRDRIVAHVVGADHAYAREIGLRGSEPDPADRRAIEAEREAVIAVLREPSDGAPLADRRWTQRYAARRVAWHTLDHAWEMEDRTEPD